MNEDVCRVVDVDGEPVRITSPRGAEWTEADQRYAAEIIRAARRRYLAEHGGDAQ